MKIIIAGAGEVGYHLARLLSHESQDIVLIDTNADRLQYAANHMDIITLKGNATSLRTLDEAGVRRCDLVIAATSSETTNITTAALAKRLGARYTIARISNTEFLHCQERINWNELGIDSLISPDELAAGEIERLVYQPAFTEIFEFAGGQLQFAGISLEEQSPILEKTVVEMSKMCPDLEFMPVALQRGNKTLIPRGGTALHFRDNLYFISRPDGLEYLKKISGRREREIRNIMILGGSKIGYKTARNLQKDFSVKLIEQNKQKAFDLADMLPQTLVIHADGRNVELMEEENIEEMDAFIAVTGNSETNIMSCLMAKAHGVPKAIALVDNMDYINLANTIGVDSLINKKLIAASSIFRHIRAGEVLSLANVPNLDAEVLEFQVKEGSRITRSPIKKLNFPDAASIGGVIRHGEGLIVLGDFEVQAGDRVVVFCLPKAIHKVEAFFK